MRWKNSYNWRNVIAFDQEIVDVDERERILVSRGYRI